MQKKPVQAAGPARTEYTPQPGDFEFLTGRDITVDRNFASMSYWKGVAIHFFRNKRAVVGLIIVAVITFLAIFGPGMNEYGYKDIVSATNADGKQIVAGSISPRIAGVIGKQDGNPLFKDRTFLFGTDTLGRDLWTRTWYGARVSLIIAFVTIIIDMIIGMSYGLISGYFGGGADAVMQRFVEIANSVPRLVIVSVLAIFMPKGMGLVIVALLLTEWIGMSKIARAEMLKLKEQEYVLASRTLGAGSFHIIFKQILPNTIGPIITQVMFSIPTAIFTEAFLSFVGVGIVLPQCSIGSLIEDGFNNITTLPYQILPPIVVLALLMLGFNFIGDGFREALAPKLEDM
ncbi:MAG: ABC transporter permease [Oscillospiraceae bacterium]|nr:ABC transporter permease [Oscillospiraceae bacterium]